MGAIQCTINLKHTYSDTRTNNDSNSDVRRGGLIVCDDCLPFFLSSLSVDLSPSRQSEGGSFTGQPSVSVMTYQKCLIGVQFQVAWT